MDFLQGYIPNIGRMRRVSMKEPRWLDLYCNDLLIDRIAVDSKADANEIIKMIEEYIENQIVCAKQSKDIVKDWPRLCLSRQINNMYVL